MLLTVQVVASLGRLIVPWSINDKNTTFAQLFQMIQAGSFDIIQMNDDLKRSTSSSMFVGAARDALMTISNSHVAWRVCLQFGYRVKFTVDASNTEEIPVTPPAVNAFGIMAAAQRQLQQGNNSLPFPQPARDGRDCMDNNLLDLMREMGIKWNDPTMHGVPFLWALHDALWYVDGHHDTITEKTPKIPEVFAKKFVGYNCPESHKHRKLTKGNLCCSELSRHALALQDKLQVSWFKKPVFRELATAVAGH